MIALWREFLPREIWEILVGDDDAPVASLIREYQRRRGLEADGIVGPRTLTSLVGEYLTEAPATLAPHDLVAARAVRYWLTGIRQGDPLVGEIIRDGLTWDSAPGIEWCGAFVAACWHDHVSLSTRRHYMASTYRLDCARRGELAPGASQPCDDLETTAMPGVGDLFVVGRRGAWGDHIGMIVGQVAGVSLTVEGNALGVFPDGSHGRGVIMRRRMPSELRWIMRPKSWGVRG